MLASEPVSDAPVPVVPVVRIEARPLDLSFLDIRLTWNWDPATLAYTHVKYQPSVLYDINDRLVIVAVAAAKTAVGSSSRPPPPGRVYGDVHLLRVGYCDGRRRWLTDGIWAVDDVEARYSAQPPGVEWVSFPVVAAPEEALDVSHSSNVADSDLELHATFLRGRLQSWRLPMAYVDHEVGRFFQYLASGGARRREMIVMVLCEFYDDDIKDTHLGVVAVDASAMTPVASQVHRELSSV